MRLRWTALGVVGFVVWIISIVAIIEWRTSSSVACGEAIAYWETVDGHFILRPPEDDSPFWDEITTAWNNTVEACES